MTDKSSSLLLIPILTITAALSLSISNVNAITTVNNTDFSINVPDNWAYRDSTSSMESILNRGPWIELIPTEFSQMLINPLQEPSGKAIEKEGAYSVFEQDISYPFRNVPLNIYAQYNLNLSEVKVLSQANATIDGEESVRIHRTPRDNSSNVQVVDYYTVHDGKPYFIQYVANVKNFQKYLPQFEQMVKSFKFTK
jgi:hypothetical protein